MAAKLKQTLKEKRSAAALNNFKAFFEDDEEFLVFVLKHGYVIYRNNAVVTGMSSTAAFPSVINYHSHDDKPALVSFAGEAVWYTEGKIVSRYQGEYYRKSVYSAQPIVLLDRAKVQQLVYGKKTQA